MHRLERGIGLILALIVLALLSLLVAAMLTAVSVEVWIGDNFTRETQLVYLAEAGIEEGREHLQKASLVPAPVPFIKDATLLDTNGRQAGRYSVTLLRSDPLTLRSAGSIGSARRTIEVRLKRSGFPVLPDAVTLNEDVPFPAGRDAQFELVRRRHFPAAPAVGAAVLPAFPAPAAAGARAPERDVERNGCAPERFLRAQDDLGIQSHDRRFAEERVAHPVEHARHGREVDSHLIREPLRAPVMVADPLMQPEVAVV